MIFRGIVEEEGEPSSLHNCAMKLYISEIFLIINNLFSITADTHGIVKLGHA